MFYCNSFSTFFLVSFCGNDMISVGKTFIFDINTIKRSHSNSIFKVSSYYEFYDNVQFYDMIQVSIIVTKRIVISSSLIRNKYSYIDMDYKALDIET